MDPDVTPRQLAGTWHIVCSTFPMWLSGRRSGPTFTYTPLADGHRMRDEVAYRTRRGARRIMGTDTRVGTAAYRWRGLGPLALLTSTWRIAERSQADTWAVITFNRSLVTPAGVDVIVRAAHLSDETAFAEALTAGERHGAVPVPVPGVGLGG
ncbi:hypothetical protein [Streptomyces sp. NPDC047123]|uniref:hypothetical protein n=1 Tax=Streptomyces sp. NPDC047123 TaxID=3155622 RepID=UPI0033F95B10